MAQVTELNPWEFCGNKAMHLILSYAKVQNFSLSTSFNIYFTIIQTILYGLMNHQVLKTPKEDLTITEITIINLLLVTPTVMLHMHS